MTEEERALRFQMGGDGNYVPLRKIIGEEAWRERQREAVRRWRENNKDKVKGYQEALTPEKKRQYNAARWQKVKSDPELHKAYREYQRAKDKKRYWKDRQGPAKPQRIATYKRSRRKGKGYEEWKKRQLEIQQWKCALCEADLSDGYHVDHIVPRHSGGGNEDTNLWILCPPCNQKKAWKRTHLI